MCCVSVSVHACVCVCPCLRVREYICACVCLCGWVCVCVCVRACACVNTYVRVSVCVAGCVCVCVCVCVQIFTTVSLLLYSNHWFRLGWVFLKMPSTCWIPAREICIHIKKHYQGDFVLKSVTPFVMWKPCPEGDRQRPYCALALVTMPFKRHWCWALPHTSALSAVITVHAYCAARGLLHGSSYSECLFLSVKKFLTMSEKSVVYRSTASA